MTNSVKMEQTLAFARVDGALVAVMWIASFACFVLQFQAPSLGLLFPLIGVASAVFAARRVKKFRDEVLDGVISFWHALLYGVTIYFYASLMFAMAQFVYFQFLDNGSMIAHYNDMAGTSEFREAMRLYGLDEKEWRLAMDNLAALKPIEIAFQFFTTNIAMGFFLSLPVALIRTKKR